jgi:predicted ester cyclase
MSTEITRETMTGYLRTLVERGPYGVYFADNVTFTMMGPGQEVKGKVEVEQFIRYFHELAFDAQVVVKNTVVDDGKATLEADFVGTHTGEFFGVPATGKQVSVPYAVPVRGLCCPGPGRSCGD